jgi:hypothetical protein
MASANSAIQALQAKQQSAAPQSAPQQDDSDATTQQIAQPSDDSGSEDEATGAGNTNLTRAFSKLNERLIDFADHMAHRTFTLPHIEGQPMHEHITAVGSAAAKNGGLTENILLATHDDHHPEAATVAYPAGKLREVVVPDDNPEAKAAIRAAADVVSKAAKFLGEDDPSVKTAKSQLSLIQKTDGAGMTCSDFIVALINLPYPVIQSLARTHSTVKHQGALNPKLTGPKKA